MQFARYAAPRSRTSSLCTQNGFHARQGLVFSNLKRIPFTLVAVGSVAFFLLAAALPPSAFQSGMLAVARVLIIPVYVVLLGFGALMRLSGTPAAGVLPDLGASIAIAAAFIPFVAADWLLHRLRSKRAAGA